jgi:hypothetical protein
MRTGQRLELGAVSLLTVGVYVLLYLVQRQLFDHGLGTSVPFVWPRTDVDPREVQCNLNAYLLVAMISCLLYAWVLFRVSQWRGRFMRILLLAVPAVLHLLALPTRPTLSIDAYSYLAHGYLAVHPPLNPYVEEASSVAAYPYGESLRQLGWLPMHAQSPYGPLWTQIEWLVVMMTGPDADTGQILIKVPVLAATWGSAIVIFALARRLVPELRWTAITGWLWNPISLVEFAGDGHIDAVMIFLVLLACYAGVRGWGYVTTVALGLAVAVKYLPVVLAPPLIGMVWRHSDSRAGVVVKIACGGVTLLALIALAFAPFWVGGATFVGTQESGRLYSSWTPSGLLRTLVGARVADPAAERITQALLVAVLVITALLVSTHVAGPRQLLRGAAVIACASFALLPGGWPWYAALPLALVLSLPTLGARILVVFLTVTTRSIAAFGDLQTLGQVPYANTVDVDGLVGVTIPGLCCVIAAIVIWWREPASAGVADGPGRLRGVDGRRGSHPSPR